MKPFTVREWIVGQRMSPTRSGEVCRCYHRNSPYIWWLRLRGLRLPPR